MADGLVLTIVNLFSQHHYMRRGMLKGIAMIPSTSTQTETTKEGKTIVKGMNSGDR